MSYKNLNLLFFMILLMIAIDCSSQDRESDFIDTGQKLIDKACDSDHFSGTVLVAKGNQVLLEKACGEASKRFHVPNDIDTKFNLGSMNKMFTAIAALQLVENGTVKLEDKINKYVDESWLPLEIIGEITIHHLLSHTSGLGSYFNSKYWKDSRELYRTVNDFKPLLRGSSLAFEPGSQYRYSNTGMLLLGVIIENSTEMDYFEYIRRNIYAKADMIHSDSYAMDEPVENLAIGYHRSVSNKYGWENNLFKHVIKGGPAGGGFSTVRDLHKFSVALLNEKLLSKRFMNLLWQDHSGADYGYGFRIRYNHSSKIVGHSGGFSGISANLDIFLDQGFIIVVLSNYDQAAINLANDLRSFDW